MKKLLLSMAVLCALTSCSNKNDIESKAKKYMADNIVPKFNDPSSYEYVSTKVDTFTVGNYIQNLREEIKDTTLFSSEERAKTLLQIDSLKTKNTDSVLHYEAVVSYRGKIN